MSDNQRNARVMWSHNDTYNWAKQILTKEDEAYFRFEARRMDRSGDNKRFRTEMNIVLEERATAGKAKQAKYIARQEATKSKLVEVKLDADAIYNELLSMKVVDLDLQIDKLREAGDKSVRAKSTLRNKDAKFQENLAGIERRRIRNSLEVNGTHTDEGIEFGIPESGLSDNVELFHPDEIAF